MKGCLTVTIDKELFKEIERLRGREKRSTFVEHLLRLGLREFKKFRSPDRKWSHDIDNINIK